MTGVRSTSKPKYFNKSGNQSCFQTIHANHLKLTQRESNYDDRFINKISQLAGKTSKISLERTLDAASRDNKSRQRLITLDEKLSHHQSTNRNI